MKKLLLLVLLLLTPTSVLACTSAVVSGKVTIDGRPLLWKHRDSDNIHNALKHFADGEFSFTAVVNADSTANTNAWMGSNQTGFAIMNTASYNIRGQSQYEGEMDQEGRFMKRALATCRTVDDFERLLEQTNGQRGVEANFGVIDAGGGAMYFEAGCFAYEKFDVNDPAIAPNGYLVRTNFSTTGSQERGYGYIRYNTACELFAEQYDEKQFFTVDYLLNEVTRSLLHSLQDVDLEHSQLPATADDRTFVAFQDYIPRARTVSVLIVQGVTPADDPALTTLWTVLGFPLTTTVFPVWVGMGDSLPEILQGDQDNPPYLNTASLALKQTCLPISVGSGQRYVDLARLVNQAGNGYLQRVVEFDRQTLLEARAIQNTMEDEGFSRRLVRDFSYQLSKRVMEFYGRMSGSED